MGCLIGLSALGSLEPLVERLALLGGTMRTVFAVFAFFVGYLVGSFFNLFM